MLSFDFILCGLLKNRDRPHLKKGTDLVYKPKKRAKKTGTDLVLYAAVLNQKLIFELIKYV